jgi:hypothetical protein
MNYILIGFIVFVLLFISNYYHQKETFNIINAHNMCHQMTAANCRIPTWQLNDCWLNEYSKCNTKCKTNMCNCATKASKICRSSDSPAEACYDSTYRKCMAGRVPGFPDPDRE